MHASSPCPLNGGVQWIGEKRRRRRKKKRKNPFPPFLLISPHFEP
jgi:hypothetical protein